MCIPVSIQFTPNVRLLHEYEFSTLFTIASQIIEKHSLGRFSNDKRMTRLPVTFQFKDNDDSISLKWEQERGPGWEAVVCDTNKVYCACAFIILDTSAVVSRVCPRVMGVLTVLTLVTVLTLLVNYNKSHYNVYSIHTLKLIIILKAIELCMYCMYIICAYVINST